MMHLYGKIVICVTCLKTVIANGWLLEDSGYLLRPWLLTPVINPTTRKQQRYNSAHTRTQSVVERGFGVLKSRFRCLDTSAGTLVYTPIKCFPYNPKHLVFQRRNFFRTGASPVFLASCRFSETFSWCYSCRLSTFF